MKTVDWNDMRYLLEVARTGSAAAAARSLGVSHATVLRRVQALESGVGSPLFERLASGYVPTDAGRQLVAASRGIESSLKDALDAVDGHRKDVGGTIRLTTTDSLAHHVVPAAIAGLRQRLPALRVESLVTSTLLDLTRRDADVALRPALNPPETWAGRPLARMDFGAYASPEYLASRQRVHWSQLDWLMANGALAQSELGRKWAELIPAERVVSAMDSFVGLRQLATLGAGIAVLPRFVARLDPRLELVLRMPTSAVPTLWILTRAGLRKTARVRAFIDFFGKQIGALQAQLQFGADEHAQEIEIR